MKGIVFTAFLEMVETHFSLEIADHIIEASSLPSGGRYTAVGTYDHSELVKLVKQLSSRTGIPVPDLVKTFGEYMFVQLAEGYPQFVNTSSNVFELLQKVDGYIHVEVRKLYPDAELPVFEFDASVPGTLQLIYKSARPFADLAEGLINGCIKHFGESITISREDLSGGDGTSAAFILTKAE
jgi:uncharacterized protein with GYD domain